MPENGPARSRARAGRLPGGAAAPTLELQLAGLAASDPVGRIDHREAILAHGVEAVGPLADLAAREPDLGPAVTAWLEVLARRDESTRPSVGTALRALSVGAGEDTRRHAAEALARLGLPAATARARRAAGVPA